MVMIKCEDYLFCSCGGLMTLRRLGYVTVYLLGLDFSRPCFWPTVSSITFTARAVFTWTHTQRTDNNVYSHININSKSKFLMFLICGDPVIRLAETHWCGHCVDLPARWACLKRACPTRSGSLWWSWRETFRSSRSETPPTSPPPPGNRNHMFFPFPGFKQKYTCDLLRHNEPLRSGLRFLHCLQSSDLIRRSGVRFLCNTKKTRGQLWLLGPLNQAEVCSCSFSGLFQQHLRNHTQHFCFFCSHFVT